MPFALTADGFETHFATNYLGHFLLLNRLAGLLCPDSRVAMVSSAGHRGADVDLDDPNFERTRYDPLVAYRRSKTATILFAVAFDQPSAASAFAWKTVAQGAATSIWAGFVAPADDAGGCYAEDCHVAEVNDDPAAGTRPIRAISRRTRLRPTA